jgi:guanylate kinase
MAVAFSIHPWCISMKHRKGRMFILSAPSGTGKTTVTHQVLTQVPGLKRSISYTTRSPRLEEKEGRDYFFVSLEEFQQKVAAGEFLEWAIVHGHYYGTSRTAIQHELDAGQDLLLVIDVQGASSLQKQAIDGVFIFLLPPSLPVLADRLRQRRSESEAAIRQRLERAREEMLHYQQYDYILINNTVTETAHALASIIYAERCRLSAFGCNFPIWREIQEYAQKRTAQR